MSTLIDDVGSYPLPAGIKRQTYDEAYRTAREYMADGKDYNADEFVRKSFSSITIASFKRKISAGLDVITSPWHYDGIRQVSDSVHKAMNKGTFIVDEKDAFLPEVRAIEAEAKNLSEEFGKKISLRVSLFGPMEQYLKQVGRVPYHDVLEGFAETIRRFARNSVLNQKYIKTTAVSIDEPSFGYVNIAAKKDVLCKILEKAFDFSGAVRQIHLHSASRLPDLLNVNNIDVVSFEYAASPKNIAAVSRKMLEETDKQIRVGVARTDIDSILAELHEKGITQPTPKSLVEAEAVIRKRFLSAKAKFGDRMTYAGPDCGLGGWPSQEAAQLLLEQTVRGIGSA